ncbi:AlpA family transcriptional regulator [Vreelandella jeotgali]|uniref:AlpA family transcriptional regulator n=1 Tax=Vreelandella jeotgali TaxID=553386 RepID=UPI00037F0C0F|nr:AlpA family transcriptional regulator [Halomonas jeotgali]
MALLRQPEVLQKCALSRSGLYRLMEAGDFPPPVSIGTRSKAWVEQEVDEWIDSLVRQRNAES